jgi:YgiT-type zinc finger domain-containing protein
MGEAKEREKLEEQGKEVPNKKFYADYDDCPVCHKALKEMDKEHDGQILMLPGGPIIVCSRCGAIFFLRSKIKFVFEELKKAKERIIVDPNSQAGRVTQELAPKILPFAALEKKV